MMIAYSQQPQVSSTAPSRFYDLFFLRGSHIHECARMNSDLRSRLQLDTALKTFQRFGQEDSTRVFLFAASTEALIRFRSTFHHDPCLKVQVQGLSTKQIHNLLAGTKCEKGILECNEFVNLVPSIDLREISALTDIAQYRPPFKRGRILIYDLEGSKGLFWEGNGRDPSTSETSANDQSPSLGKGENRSQNKSPGLSSCSQFSATDEKEAEEFTEFITRFLKSTPTSDSGKLVAGESAFCDPDRSEKQNTGDLLTQPNIFVITHREDDDQSPAIIVGSQQTPPRRRAETMSSPPIHGREHGPIRKPRTNRSSATTPATPFTPESSEFVRLFERLFRSFRQQAFEVFGNKSDAVIAEAERKIRFLNPEFDLHALNETTATLVLDIIEITAVAASFMKRSRLRQAALTLVADLYNKQYELLEKNRAIDKVEQFYYRLKK
jgi:hypothetical protein